LKNLHHFFKYVYSVIAVNELNSFSYVLAVSPNIKTISLERLQRKYIYLKVQNLIIKSQVTLVLNVSHVIILLQF